MPLLPLHTDAPTATQGLRLAVVLHDVWGHETSIGLPCGSL
jgi:hypothetical protein